MDPKRKKKEAKCQPEKEWKPGGEGGFGRKSNLESAVSESGTSPAHGQTENEENEN